MDRHPAGAGLVDRPDPLQGCLLRLDAPGVANPELGPDQGVAALGLHVLRAQILVGPDLEVVDLLRDLGRPANGGEPR